MKKINIFIVVTLLKASVLMGAEPSLDYSKPFKVAGLCAYIGLGSYYFYTCYKGEKVISEQNQLVETVRNIETLGRNLTNLGDPFGAEHDVPNDQTTRWKNYINIPFDEECTIDDNYITRNSNIFAPKLMQQHPEIKRLIKDNCKKNRPGTNFSGVITIDSKVKRTLLKQREDAIKRYQILEERDKKLLNNLHYTAVALGAVSVGAVGACLYKFCSE